MDEIATDVREGSAEISSEGMNCPEGIPEEFWDGEKHELRTETLIQSYLNLEKQLENSLPIPSKDEPETIEKVLSALGRPETPDGYQINQDLEGFELDTELNETLHAAGFSQAQANLVYELAAEKLKPALQSIEEQKAIIQQQVRLENHFGGPERFKQVATDLQQWGENHFGCEAFDQIASSYEGVLALHQMMQTSEPEMVGGAGGGITALTKEQLDEMVADPRYWQERDPEFIARVTEGYVKLFSE